MASRFLTRSRALTARASPLGARGGLHTSSVSAKLLDKLFKQPDGDAEAHMEPQSKAKVSLIQRLGAMRRRGGYDQGAGMPLYVPIKAKNIERAWEIWARHMRRPDSTVSPPTKETLVDLVLLIANAVRSRAAGIETDAIRAKQPVAGFRITTLLQHIFAESVREQGARRSDELCELSSFDLRLGVSAPSDYAHMIALVLLAADCSMPSGNTRAIDAATAEDLALEISNMPTTRLVQLLVQAAIQDGVTVDAGILRAVLAAMAAMHDVAAACDTLALCYPSLAELLDPGLVRTAQTQKAALGDPLTDPMGELCSAAVAGMLQIAKVGTDPNQLAVDPNQPQEDLSYEQLDGIVDYSSKEPTEDELKKLNTWRTATAERIYRAYVSAGISQVPAPDNSTHPALLGSVVPTPGMVATVLEINLAAGDIELAALYYEALKAVLHQLQPSVSTDGFSNAAACHELKPGHKMDADLWVRMVQTANASGQIWLAAQLLGGMAGDNWAPLQVAYERYLDGVGDPSEASLAKIIDELRDSMLANNTSVADPALLEPLICALVGQRDRVPAEHLAVRIEQALLLSGLSDNADSAQTAAVSDETAREILRALVANDQIARAQDLADAWGSARPELVTHQYVAELIRGLGRTGKHAQALELFTDYQQLDQNEITLEMLCAVLEVYTGAGDYAEAISVGKRIRRLVSADPQRLPSRDTFNCLLSAYCHATQPGEAMRVLEEMRRYRVHADSDTYTILVLAMSALRSLEGLKLIAALANVDYNLAARESDQDYSPPLVLDTDYYNALIEAYGRMAEPMLALQVWEVMRFRGVRPNHLTATLLMDTCGWCERVHWDEDMKSQLVFVNHEVPDDYVYTGAKLLYYHFLGSALQQLQQAGLEFSLANYQHMIETLLRGAFLDDVVTMLIGRYEEPEETAMWIRRTYDARFDQVNPLIRDWVKRTTPPATEGGKEISGHAVTRFMTDYLPPIPLCKETVATTYGAVEVLRGKFVSEDDPRVEVQLAYRSKGLVFAILDLHEERLDRFLAAKRPDLLPDDRRQRMQAAEQAECAQ
ncbi:hypothetical protein IWW52_001563 [Coemansia sp. RSA 2704]|nr:hypothetical protein IWW52_001563 [Coemansia sp. RSA 2704]